jgi:hypothetical protein
MTQLPISKSSTIANVYSCATEHVLQVAAGLRGEARCAQEHVLQIAAGLVPVVRCAPECVGKLLMEVAAGLRASSEVRPEDVHVVCR